VFIFKWRTWAKVYWLGSILQVQNELTRKTQITQNGRLKVYANINNNKTVILEKGWGKLDRQDYCK
jgi:hypothetical protein